jgi:hypothetical protein
LARAEEGLLHVMGVLRERDEVRTGVERSTRRLQHALHLNRSNEAAARGAIERLDAPGRPNGVDRDRDAPIGTDRRIGQRVTRGFHGLEMSARRHDRMRQVD